jgi:hypothetical protein
MQALESHIGNEQQPAGHVREQHAGNFRKLFRDICPCFTEGLIATWATHTTLKTRFRMPSCPLTSTWISSRGRRKMTTWLTTIVTNSAFAVAQKTAPSPRIFG